MLSIVTESFGLHLIDVVHLTDAKNLYQLSDMHLIMCSLSVKTELSVKTDIFVFSCNKAVHGISIAYFERSQVHSRNKSLSLEYKQGFQLCEECFKASRDLARISSTS